MEKPDTYGQVTGAFEIFELLLIANQGVTKSKKGFKMLFLESFEPPEPQLSSITTKIDTEVEYYHTCVNLLVKF